MQKKPIFEEEEKNILRHHIWWISLTELFSLWTLNIYEAHSALKVIFGACKSSNYNNYYEETMMANLIQDKSKECPFNFTSAY